uniref:Uncharacterized protein n=1 Tax=Rhizophora mucronata TaxID=61149 RepID=A0A2P2IXD6_RHIMU
MEIHHFPGSLCMPLVVDDCLNFIYFYLGLRISSGAKHSHVLM